MLTEGGVNKEEQNDEEAFHVFLSAFRPLFS
jgi:hypothetical protein